MTISTKMGRPLTNATGLRSVRLEGVLGARLSCLHHVSENAHSTRTSTGRTLPRVLLELSDSASAAAGALGTAALAAPPPCHTHSRASSPPVMMVFVCACGMCESIREWMATSEQGRYLRLPVIGANDLGVAGGEVQRRQHLRVRHVQHHEVAPARTHTHAHTHAQSE